MSSELNKKRKDEKFIRSAKFEAKEQFTSRALENLSKENDRLINNLRKAGEIDELNL